MRRHHRVELAGQLPERLHVTGTNVLQAALVDGNRHVGVGLGPAMSGEVLAGRRHARLLHATDERRSQLRGTLRVTLEGTTADHRAALMIEVEYRREAEIQADGQYLGRHQPAAVLGQLLGVVIVGDGAHRRQAQEALAQALHPSAFLIHGQQQVRAHGTNALAQLAHLARRFDIAGKNDQAAHLGLAQHLAILGGQPGASDIHHQ